MGTCEREDRKTCFRVLFPLFFETKFTCQKMCHLKVCNSVVVSILTKLLCNHQLQFQNIFHPSKWKPHTYQQSFPNLPSFQPLVTTNLLLVFMDLPVMDISYKWGNTLCGHFCLASFIQHDVFKVNPCCNMYQYFVSFYGCIIFRYIDMPYLFIGSSVNGQLSGFHFLAVINNAAMNVNMFFCQHMFSILLDISL